MLWRTRLPGSGSKVKAIANKRIISIMLISTNIIILRDQMRPVSAMSESSWVVVDLQQIYTLALTLIRNYAT